MTALVVAAPAHAIDPSALRVVTYNIHSGLGSGFAWRRSLADVETQLRAIGEAIATAPSSGAPLDVIGLNEVDFASRRSAWVDEAAFLANDLSQRTGERYEVVRGETWRRSIPGFEVCFGNAALVRHPILRSAICVLDDGTACTADVGGTSTARRPRTLLGRLLGEARGVIAMTLDMDGRPLDVRVTHLDAFAQREREWQAGRLIDHLVDAARSTIVLGDMNAVPAPLVRRFFTSDRTPAILTRGLLADVRAAFAAAYAEGTAPLWPTFPAAAPQWPLDWVLGTSDLRPTVMKTVGDLESDHRGLYVAFDWPNATPAKRVSADYSPAG